MDGAHPSPFPRRQRRAWRHRQRRDRPHRPRNSASSPRALPRPRRRRFRPSQKRPSASHPDVRQRPDPPLPRPTPRIPRDPQPRWPRHRSRSRASTSAHTNADIRRSLTLPAANPSERSSSPRTRSLATSGRPTAHDDRSERRSFSGATSGASIRARSQRRPSTPRSMIGSLESTATPAKRSSADSRSASSGRAEWAYRPSSALARLGVGNIIVIDPQRVDPTNLPRLPESTRRDAKLLLRAPSRPSLDSHNRIATRQPESPGCPTHRPARATRGQRRRVPQRR